VSDVWASVNCCGASLNELPLGLAVSAAIAIPTAERISASVKKSRVLAVGKCRLGQASIFLHRDDLILE
jgi:hypothetical protein